jgi:hypothetical protein
VFPFLFFQIEVGNNDLRQGALPQLKAPYRDGTTGDRRSHVIFESLDFIACLAALEPKPRVNLTRLDEKHSCFSHFGQPLVVQIHSR